MHVPRSYPQDKKQTISDHRNTQQKKCWPNDIHMRNYYRPQKWPRENILNPQNALTQKFRTHEILIIKNVGPTKYTWETISDPKNNHGKIFWTLEILTRKNFGPTKYRKRKNFGSMKYPREQILHQRNACPWGKILDFHEGTVVRWHEKSQKPQWHESHKIWHTRLN